MFNLKYNSGIGEMVFLTRVVFCFLVIVFSIINAFSNWILPAFIVTNILCLAFLAKRFSWVKRLYLVQYFLDALVCCWSIFFFQYSLFFVFPLLFVMFSRYQGGIIFGRIVASFFVISYITIYYFTDKENFESLFVVSVIIPILLLLFSLRLGSMLCNIYLEKNMAIEDLEIRIKNKDRLLSTLAHELRTPLTMVVSSSGILIDEIKQKITETHFGFLNTINDSALRLVTIVEDILAQIKAEKSLLKINVNKIDLRQLVKQVVANMSPILSKKEQYIRCSYPKLLHYVQADEKWLHQALVNLVHNASKYIAYGGSILISVKENEQYFVVSVIDDGLGIEDVNTMNIFSGSQVDDDYQSYEGGAGIGLSIVKHIVEQHGGKLYVGTVPGTGTTLSFTLPK